MDAVIGFANAVFKPLIDLGAAPMMTIVLTIIALLFKVKFSKALEGGLKLGIAITGIGAIINILTTAFSAAMKTFVESTGLQLTITDVGWAPLATITWGSPYTLYFLMVLVIVNIVMIVLAKTNTIESISSTFGTSLSSALHACTSLVTTLQSSSSPRFSSSSSASSRSLTPTL